MKPDGFSNDDEFILTVAGAGTIIDVLCNSLDDSWILMEGVMGNCRTTYMGLDLKTPIIAGSCGLTGSLKEIVALEKHGASAVVLKSLFEEEILTEAGSLAKSAYDTSYAAEAGAYIDYYVKQNQIGDYLDLIKKAKDSVSIPVIASINCLNTGEWVKFAEKIDKAGVDALELNIFFLPSDTKMKAEDIEKRYFRIVRDVKQLTSKPVSLKLSPYFTSLARTFKELSDEVNGLVLFNRFFNPDIDINKKQIISAGVWSSPADIVMPLRWIGILSDKVSCDLALSSGVHDGAAVIKGLLAGARVVYVASALYQSGITMLGRMGEFLAKWMDDNNYEAIDEFRGLLNQKNVPDQDAYERGQFMKFYSSHKE